VNNSFTDLAIVPLPGKDGKESKVLGLTYSVDSDVPAQNGFWTKLMGFDGSQYDHFEMDVKGDAARGFTEKFKIEIKKCLDRDCLETVQGSAVIPVTAEWQTVSVPLNQLTGLIDFQNPEAWKNPRISLKSRSVLLGLAKKWKTFRFSIKTNLWEVCFHRKKLVNKVLDSYFSNFYSINW
jgi:hypothetical protein